MLRGLCQETYLRRSVSCRPYSILFRPPDEPHSNQFGNRSTQSLVIELESQWLSHVRDYGVNLDAPVSHGCRSYRSGLRSWVESCHPPTNIALTFIGKNVAFHSFWFREHPGRSDSMRHGTAPAKAICLRSLSKSRGRCQGEFVPRTGERQPVD